MGLVPDPEPKMLQNFQFFEESHNIKIISRKSEDKSDLRMSLFQKQLVDHHRSLELILMISSP